MQTFAIAVITIIPVLAIMIVIHELGHHLVAKFFGVRVDTFSVGFGKRLFGFRLGETDYRVSAVPFGGYVKMAGENPMEQRSGAPDEFMSHPRWQRVLIALAGPAMNIVLAIVMLTGVFMIHWERDLTLEMPVVIGVVEPDSPASKAGLQAGDRIIRVDNKENPNWEDWRFKEILNSQASLNLLVQRADKILPFSLRPETRDGDPYIGIGPEERNVSVVEPNMPAAKAGMLQGDEIVAMNGNPMHSMVSIRDFTKSNGDKPMTVTVLRQGQNLDLSVTPVLDSTKGEKTFRMGIASSRPTKIEKLPFSQAFPLALDTSRKFSFLIVETVKKLVERKVSLKQMDGPVGMARATGAAASQKGWTPLATLMALISLNLGIFNLLPIPILDGGLILLTFIESIIRRDIDQRVKERIYQTAFVFLVIFAVTVVYNDVSKIPGLTKYLP